MQFVIFLITALFGIFLLILAQTGFFNVNPFLVIKQTQNIISNQEPTQIHIPSINIKTIVHRVGIDASGKMNAPQNESVVAWYQFSATPGEPGNVVLSGHKDSSWGPAVFFTLKQLQNGSEVLLTRADNKIISYRVSSVQTIPRENLPVDKIFSDQKKSKKAYIITCDGNFNFFTRQYDRRVLVEAEAS
jgi:LPXTG-site transpeptidase (sortase) family protein